MRKEWLLKIKNITPSFLMKKIRNSKSLSMKKPSQLESSIYKIHYRHIRELPLNIFIDILCDGKFELLGEAPLEVLVEVFEEILDQYNNAIGCDDVKAKISKTIKIFLLESKISRANSFINILKVFPNEDVFNQLFKFNYQLPAFKYSIENVANLVAVFEGYVKRDAFELQGLIDNFNKLNPTNDEKHSREKFIDMIVSLCDHFKMSIDEQTITTEKYCGFVKRYLRDVERLISNQNKK